MPDRKQAAAMRVKIFGLRVSEFVALRWDQVDLAGECSMSKGPRIPDRSIRSGLSLMTLKEIRQALENALLHQGEMHRELYEYDKVG
ncbi:MAG: hypothetical protein EA420_16845 [Candidatus Competibacteraceae bacterium]|nr:MAG: hypothetical protein EA420_16845 [Candidatus Competibacteraceae bacterium]